MTTPIRSRSTPSHPHEFDDIYASIESFKNSFFIRTVKEWNRLPQATYSLSRLRWIPPLLNHYMPFQPVISPAESISLDGKNSGCLAPEKHPPNQMTCIILCKITVNPVNLAFIKFIVFTPQMSLWPLILVIELKNQ